MLKKLPVLLLLCALCVWAADFWTTKPFTEWNEKEVQKLLTDSPWVGKVTMSGGGRAPGRCWSRVVVAVEVAGVEAGAGTPAASAAWRRWSWRRRLWRR